MKTTIEKEPKLSRKAKTLIEEFKDDSGIHYYMQDRGFGKEVDDAEENYKKSRAKLIKFVSDLEAKIKLAEEKV